MSISRRIRWASTFVFIFTMAVCLSFSLNSFAEDKGFYIEQKVKSGGVMGQPPSEQVSKMYFTPTKVKMITDESGESEMIMDFDTSQLYIVNTKEKKYFEIAKKEYEAMLNMGMAMMEGMMGDAAPTVEATGEKKKIGSWNCEKVTLSMGGQMAMTMEMWVTKETNIDMDDYLQMSDMLGQSTMFKSFQDEMKKIGGYPIQTKTTMNIMGNNVESLSEVQVIREETFPAQTFKVPEGFVKEEGGSFMEAMQSMKPSGQ